MRKRRFERACLGGLMPKLGSVSFFAYGKVISCFGACSSVVEREAYIFVVGGSIPPKPTRNVISSFHILRFAL